MAKVRRHLIIERRFQIGFTLAFVRGILLAVAIPAGSTFLAVLIVSKNPGLTDVQRLALSNATHHLATFFLIVCVALSLMAAVIGLVLSHRYAGPLKRIESWLARHLLGETVGDLVLRPGDELAPMSAALCRLMKKEKRR